MPASLAASLPLGETIVIELAGTPIGKGRPRARRLNGRLLWYTPPETAAYERRLAWAGKVAMGSRKPLSGPLKVTVTATFEAPPSWSGVRRIKAYAGEIRPSVKPDADNILKALDGLNDIVWVDDAQIVDCTIRKHYGTSGLRIEVIEL